MLWVAGVLAWVVVIGLLALTLACQRPRWAWLKTLKYHDVIAAIPSWTFFAPNPGTTDTRVMWRECLLDGALSPWHEVLPPTGGLLRAIWNPNKRESKLLTDCGQIIVRMALNNPKSELILVSVPYLLLLHHVTGLPTSSLVAARQFLVVQTTGEGIAVGAMRPLFASRWHAIVPGVSLPDAAQESNAVGISNESTSRASYPEAGPTQSELTP